MIWVAFTLIGGANWKGGYNYLLNLVRALSAHEPGRVQPVIFFGIDVNEKDAEPFEHIAGTLVVRNAAFDRARIGDRLTQALLTGCDHVAAEAFAAHGIDVVFESAQFYGWRFPVPTLAWIPDFQHRHLKHLFDLKAYWKREIGFRVQTLSGRHVMLSSEDARLDCERFYPVTRSRTHVVRFAVPAANAVDVVAARAVADSYGLPETFFFLPNQFWKHKNHECVIQALLSLKAKGCEKVVAVSGKQADPRDPQHFPRLQRLIEENDLGRNFLLLGLIPHSHIPALMRTCSALINPSTFEGWSTTVEEAKAVGTPMILSSLRVHREQSEQAIFFDPYSPDQLAEIMKSFLPVSAESRLSMCEIAIQNAKDSTRIFAQEFVNLLERLVVRS